MVSSEIPGGLLGKLYIKLLPFQSGIPTWGVEKRSGTEAWVDSITSIGDGCRCQIRYCYGDNLKLVNHTS